MVLEVLVAVLDLASQRNPATKCSGSGGLLQHARKTAGTTSAMGGFFLSSKMGFACDDVLQRLDNDFMTLTICLLRWKIF